MVFKKWLDKKIPTEQIEPNILDIILESFVGQVGYQWVLQFSTLSQKHQFFGVNVCVCATF